MTEQTTAEIIENIILKITTRQEIDRASSLVDDLDFDSLDTVELPMMLEDQFGIEISDDEISRVFTVQQVIDTVNAKLEKKAA